MRPLEFITGHVIYNPAYTYKLQLKTTLNLRDEFLFFFPVELWYSPDPKTNYKFDQNQNL